MKKKYKNPMVERLDFLPEDLFANGTDTGISGTQGGGEPPEGTN